MLLLGKVFSRFLGFHAAIVPIATSRKIQDNLATNLNMKFAARYFLFVRVVATDLCCYILKYFKNS
jgi:hypothetical protein